jgi:hypothetical protein
MFPRPGRASRPPAPRSDANTRSRGSAAAGDSRARAPRHPPRAAHPTSSEPPPGRRSLPSWLPSSAPRRTDPEVRTVAATSRPRPVPSARQTARTPTRTRERDLVVGRRKPVGRERRRRAPVEEPRSARPRGRLPRPLGELAQSGERAGAILGHRVTPTLNCGLAPGGHHIVHRKPLEIELSGLHGKLDGRDRLIALNQRIRHSAILARPGAATRSRLPSTCLHRTPLIKTPRTCHLRCVETKALGRLPVCRPRGRDGFTAPLEFVRPGAEVSGPGFVPGDTAQPSWKRHCPAGLSACPRLSASGGQIGGKRVNAIVGRTVRPERARGWRRRSLSRLDCRECCPTWVGRGAG